MAVPARPASGAPIDSTWGGVVHDTAVAQDTQSGYAQGAATAVARYDLPVVFARPFAPGSIPNVVLGSTGSNVVLAQMPAVPTATGFTVGFFRRDGANLTAGQGVACMWIATGPRA